MCSSWEEPAAGADPEPLHHRPQKLGQYMQTIPMCRSGLWLGKIRDPIDTLESSAYIDLISVACALHCRGGGQVTNEAEGFTEARSAERGGAGEGVILPQVGCGGPPLEIFWEIASKWCILSAFWGNQYTFFALKIYMKKMRLTKFTYRLFIFFLQNFEKFTSKWCFLSTY